MGSHNSCESASLLILSVGQRNSAKFAVGGIVLCTFDLQGIMKEEEEEQRKL